MKNLTLLILQGIPASGKTTWARKFIEGKSKEWVIVNRDSIRNMLGEYWVPSREKLVSNIEQISVSNAFGQGYNVILDATNLNPKTLKTFEEIVEHFIKDRGFNITIEYKKFDVTLKQALRRDLWRHISGNRSVGRKVVIDFYNRYYGKKK